MIHIPKSVLVGKNKRIKIIGFVSQDKHWNHNVLAQCFCKRQWVVRLKALLCGNTTCCGCQYGSHKQSKTRLYKRWTSMKQRCYNKKFKQWKDYGGRGIKVCKKWLHSFEAFWKDVGNIPKGRTLDRINNDGDYKPSNIRWATRRQQQYNRRISLCHV